MPDWTYHPAYRPLVFRLPAEDARRLTMWLLSIQGRTRPGRELFRMLSYGLGDDPLELWGLRFASRYGLGPDIDAEATAFSVLQYLGCGFLTAGPVATAGRARVRRLDRQRLPGCHGLIRPAACCAPTPEAIASNLRHRSVIKVPVAAVIDDGDAQTAIRILEPSVDFFSIRGGTPQHLAQARAATTKPLLLRIPLDADVHSAIEAAIAAKLDGVVLGDGVAFAGAPDMTMDSRHALPVVLEQLRSARERFGRDFPIVASGGVVTPECARACINAGADLVEIDTGFVYSGPGLIARALAAPMATAVVEPHGVMSAHASRVFARIINVWSIVGVVAAARLPLSALAVMWTLAALAAGLAGLARRGDAWTSWGFAAVAAASLPIDPWLAGLGLAALIAVERDGWLRSGFRPLFATRLNAWRWSAASLGRVAVQCAAVAAAAAIVALPLTADVRLAALATCGVLLLLATRGIRPGARAVWAALAAGVIGTVILAFVFYGAWWQRALASAAAALGAMGMAWLWKPLVELDEDAPRFPDV